MSAHLDGLLGLARAMVSSRPCAPERVRDAALIGATVAEVLAGRVRELVAELGRPCPWCGTALPAGFLFCDRCGHEATVPAAECRCPRCARETRALRPL